MTPLRTFSVLLAIGAAVVITSCASKSNEPPKPKMSSMPHNMPASWEANAGMPGMPTSGAGY